VKNVLTNRKKQAKILETEHIEPFLIPDEKYLMVKVIVSFFLIFEYFEYLFKLHDSFLILH
jgi:hypothetical protein